MRAQHVAPLVAALSPAFFIQTEHLRDAIRHAAQERTNPRMCSSFAVLHKATAFKVDVFLFRGRPFERSELARRVHEIVAIDPEQRAYVATAEDMILTKLECTTSATGCWISSGGTYWRCSKCKDSCSTEPTSTTGQRRWA